MDRDTLIVLIAVIALIVLACALFALTAWLEATAERRHAARRRRVREAMLREELGRLHGRYRRSRR